MPRLKPSEVIDKLSKARAINLDELATEMLEAFGGPRGYSDLCRAEFDKDNSPAMARAKLLEGVRHLYVAASIKSKASDDMSGCTEEELYEAVEIITGKQSGEEEAQEAT